MALINFKLRHPDNIAPWGTPPNTSMHWFGLTDSEYWLDLGKANIYEYSDEVLKHWNVDSIKYVDYQLIRLIEDWASIFQDIAEPIPDAFYAISKNHQSLYEFYRKATIWLEKLSDDPTIDIDTYYDKYDKIIEWIYSRTLSAMHLTHGPNISFFRNKNSLSIVWGADQLIDDKIPVWTSQTGEIEMEYETFIHEIKDLGNRFFEAMDNQVQIAVNKDWGITNLDKEGLVKEHEERKAEFNRSLLVLKDHPAKQTNWDLITSLINEMNS
jgi:hypothetical protein